MSRKGCKVVSWASYKMKKKTEKYPVLVKIRHPMNLFLSLSTPGFGFRIAY